MSTPSTELGENLNDECEFSGLAKFECEHCRSGIAPRRNPYSDYQVKGTFTAKFPGSCRIDSAHKIRKGDTLGRLVLAGNPFAPVSGFACETCAKELPEAE